MNSEGFALDSQELERGFVVRMNADWMLRDVPMDFDRFQQDFSTSGGALASLQLRMLLELWKVRIGFVNIRKGPLEFGRMLNGFPGPGEDP